jgi:chemotaxis protein histidine kinase CheA
VVSRRAITIAQDVEDPKGAMRTLHALRGAAAMMGAPSLAARLAAIESAMREDPDGTAPVLADVLVSALTAAGIDPSPLYAITSLPRPAIVPGPGLLELRSSSAPPSPAASPSDPPRSAQSDALPATSSSHPPGVDRTSADRISFERVSGEHPSSPPAHRPRSSVDPDIRAFFISEARNRLESFASAITRADEAVEGGRVEALRDAFRHAHAIKGSASTVGYHGIAMAAHAMESALAGLISSGADGTTLSVAALADAGIMLTAALTVPDQAESVIADVQTLLKQAGYSQEPAALRASPRANAEPSRGVDAVRVPATALHTLGERMTDIASVGERVAGASARSVEFGRALADLSASLEDAIRRLGPPRPWGVAADVLERFHSVSRFLRDTASALEAEGVGISREADILSAITAEAREGLQQMSVTQVRWLFERVVPVADAAARTSGKELRVLREGEDVELPRAVAERLVEPLAQLVRNAIVHGIEAPTRRLGRHKSVRGTLRLSSRRREDMLVLSVEDDGAGVDIEAVRSRGRAAGLIAQDATVETALALLFLPGFSTRSRADTAAGRGVGLDLVRREAIDLGGDVRIESSAGRGTKFTLEIPVRSGARGVLVVASGHLRVAVPIERVLRVRVRDEHESYPSLAEWLGISDGSHQRGANVVDLFDGESTLSLGVDWIERAKDVVVRPLPALCAGVGAWTGAVIEPEGTVLLVVDPARVDRGARAQTNAG